MELVLEAGGLRIKMHGRWRGSARARLSPATYLVARGSFKQRSVNNVCDMLTYARSRSECVLGSRLLF